MAGTERYDLEHVIGAAREHEPDLYAIALLAPRAVRADLIAIAAYAGELRRIPLSVADPNLALIRLQWWRDAIEHAGGGSATGNPVADSVCGAIARHGLALPTATAPLAAAETALVDEALGAAALLAYLDDAGTSLLQLTARVLGLPDDGPCRSRIEATGRAWAATRLALDLPYHIRHGRLPGRGPDPIPELEPPSGAGEDGAAVSASPEHAHEQHARAEVGAVTARLAGIARSEFARVRASCRQLSASERLSILPAALVEPYLAALERAGRDPLREPAEIVPLSRLARLWLARWRGPV